jgi:hypothetical protein
MQYLKFNIGALTKKKKTTPNVLSYFFNQRLFIAFQRNNIFKTNDIWVKKNKTFVENQTIFKRLDDERDWISESAKTKQYQ